MNNIIKLTFLSVVLLTFGCNPLEDVYEELDVKDPGLVKDFEYTLTGSDYGMFSGKANEDSLVAENNMFVDLDQAKRLIPEVLANSFAQFGATSSAKVYFEVNGGLEELSSYVNASSLYVGAEELGHVDEAAAAAGFLSPSYNVEESLIAVLNAEVQDPLEGAVYAVAYDYAAEDPIVDFEAAGVKAVHNEKFTSNIDGYTSVSVAGDQVWEYNQYFYENAAFSGYSGGPVANDDWLVSPEIDLTEYTDAELRFHQVINYLNAAPEEILKVKVSTNYDGDVTTATWTELTVDQWPAGNSWSEEVWSTIDISAYDGEVIVVAFEYVTTEVLDAPTWEISEVVVSATADVYVEVVEEPLRHTDYYEYVGGEWSLVDGVYTLLAPDYDAMGEASGLPGRYDNFSGTANPDDYLPVLLKTKFPYAQEEDQLIVMYKYYNGSTTLTLGDIYTYLDGTWNVTRVNLNFGFNGSEWIPDNTIKYELGFNDYQAIGDATAISNPPGSASVLQYRNFDIALWSSQEIFDAVTNRLKEVFPDTEEGQKYLVTYATWNPGDGTGELYVIFENGEYILFED